MLTEEEAKTKWCSHAVASHTNPRMGFDDPSYPKVFACIGSACMAWRWGEAPTKIVSSGRVALPIKTGERPKSGYCGLAGKAGA